MAMFLDKSGTLIKYLSDSSGDLIITDSDADTSLSVELVNVNLCFSTILADNLSNILDALLEL